MLRTHLAITVLAVLLFLQHISGVFGKSVFVVVALAATYIPDIDTAFSTIGRFKGARIIQFFVKHRGLFHSFTFCILVSAVLAFSFPILALPFFLGYGLHLFADSFTVEGIKPFWPSHKSSNWVVRTGGISETSLFGLFIVADLVALAVLVKGIF